MSLDDAITRYSTSQPASHKAICLALRAAIDGALPKATSKIWHAMPVWFVGESPVVGFKASTQGVTLLFWNGQSFGKTALVPVDKFKAAQIRYQDVTAIDARKLHTWLRKSGVLIWDIRSVRRPAKGRGKSRSAAAAPLVHRHKA